MRAGSGVEEEKRRGWGRGSGGGGEGRKGRREKERRRKEREEGERRKERKRVEPRNSAAASSCGTPRFPPDCFKLVLEPWAFWVLEAVPDPTIPPAPHPAA